MIYNINNIHENYLQLNTHKGICKYVSLIIFFLLLLFVSEIQLCNGKCALSIYVFLNKNINKYIEISDKRKVQEELVFRVN
jgi:hypothetical protein